MLGSEGVLYGGQRIISDHFLLFCNFVSCALIRNTNKGARDHTATFSYKKTQRTTYKKFKGFRAELRFKDVFCEKCGIFL